MLNRSMFFDFNHLNLSNIQYICVYIYTTHIHMYIYIYIHVYHTHSNVFSMHFRDWQFILTGYMNRLPHMRASLEPHIWIRIFKPLSTTSGLLRGWWWNSLLGNTEKYEKTQPFLKLTSQILKWWMWRITMRTFGYLKLRRNLLYKYHWRSAE